MGSIKKILSVFLIIFFFFSLTKNFFDYRKKIQFYESSRSDFEKIKKENITLKTEILKKKDPNEVEKTIRNELNLSKPEETVIVVPMPSIKPTILTPTPLPNWRQWLNTFSPS